MTEKRNGPGRPRINSGEKTQPYTVSLTPSEVEAIRRLGDGNLTEGIRRAIKPMKEIKVGEVNDLHIFAIEADGRYYPMKPMDRIFEKADAKIYYDSGLYPGITLEELPQYICDKARDAE